MRSLMRIVGSLVLLAGLALATYAYFWMDITVKVTPEASQALATGVAEPGMDTGRVTNLGLMSEKQDSILYGLGLMALGAFFLAYNREPEAAPVARERAEKIVV